MRYLIVTNSVAGRGRSARLAEAVGVQLRKLGAECDVAAPRTREETTDFVRQALAGAAASDTSRLALVPCGGDGTLHEVVNIVMNEPHDHAVLGLAPAGRCNDFASALGVCCDPERIASTLLSGRTRRVDLGRIGNCFFCSVATLGFDSAVARYVNDMSIPLTGAPAYVFGALRMLLRYRSSAIRLELDGHQLDGPLFLAATANTASYGGRMQIAPDADPCDGRLDVCVIRRVSRRRAVRLLLRVIRGRHVDMPDVHVVRTSRVRIESNNPHEVWADGEFVARTPVSIDVVPGALEVIVPQAP